MDGFAVRAVFSTTFVTCLGGAVACGVGWLAGGEEWLKALVEALLGFERAVEPPKNPGPILLPTLRTT